MQVVSLSNICHITFRWPNAEEQQYHHRSKTIRSEEDNIRYMESNIRALQDRNNEVWRSIFLEHPWKINYETDCPQHIRGHMVFDTYWKFTPPDHLCAFLYSLVYGKPAYSQLTSVLTLWPERSNVCLHLLGGPRKGENHFSVRFTRSV